MLHSMTERGEPNWQPIGMLPVLLEVVSGMVDGAGEHERLLRDAPRYSLDTDTLDGVERVYRDGAADNGVFARQLDRWRREHPGAEGLAEFAAAVERLAPAYQRVLDLVTARRDDTIEALHAKSDLQIGLEALLGEPVPTTGQDDRVDDGHDEDQDAEAGDGTGRRGQCAALVFDLIGGYLDDAPDRVAQIAGQVRATGLVGEVLQEALRFTAFLTMQGEAAGTRLPADAVRTAVLAKLGTTLPPHHELAVSTALDLFLSDRPADAVTAFGDGPDGDLLALHAVTAYTAVLGTHLAPPGEFTSTALAAMGALMHHRS